ncbi:calcineurin-like phosphoesterase [Desulfuromonas soudanensis]|uniref:Calcineurin-like phosphoesterase n=1 Tax=Desulfuromonas soudanensis TaxID=1603606 RepID=A0A0M5INC4_9BACT|nr:metallophosphoesterase [Desulfuromonas soudanensis]ALC15948.1 calcineurin-like phosphoesterase [Desulfuromonas soudanensis]
MSSEVSRRIFLQQLGAAAAVTALPLSLVEIAWGAGKGESFTFAYISDPHITQIKGTEFVDNFDKGLAKAVLEVNFMFPQPDFVVFGGDLAQLGKPEELDHGMEMLSKLTLPVRYVIGEHDYYLDLGKYWEEKISKLNYSFDHKGVHFVVLNSILTDDDWTHKRWPTAAERMQQMARLDNPDGSPFMVKEAQRNWLKADLAKIDKKTPIVVMSHSPLYKIYKGWNFWTDDAEEVQALLQPFQQVTVLHGHVHQILYNQIGNITFHAMMSTAWPWPYPHSFAGKPSMVPKLTVPMNRADPFHERDATGWSAIDLASGKVTNRLELWENTPRTVAEDEKTGLPADSQYQDPAKRIPPQDHY